MKESTLAKHREGLRKRKKLSKEFKPYYNCTCLVELQLNTKKATELFRDLYKINGSMWYYLYISKSDVYS